MMRFTRSFAQGNAMMSSRSNYRRRANKNSSGRTRQVFILTLESLKNVSRTFTKECFFLWSLVKRFEDAQK